MRRALVYNDTICGRKEVVLESYLPSDEARATEIINTNKALHPDRDYFIKTTQVQDGR